MSTEAIKEAAKSPYGGEKTWSQYMTDIYHGRKPPVIGTLYMDELEQKAKEKLRGYPSEHPKLNVFDVRLNPGRLVPIRFLQRGQLRG